MKKSTRVIFNSIILGSLILAFTSGWKIAGTFSTVVDTISTL